MREIKFRAWDTKDKRMVHMESVYFPNTGNLNDFGNKRYVHLQYTGLKDKNGKEIYEGDVVNQFRTSRSFPEGRNLKRVVEWNDDMTLDDSYGERAVGFNLFGGQLEVIGNIYENPEVMLE